MRFAILGISHETNTFSSVPADYARFEEEGVLRGAEIVEEFGNSEATIAGFLQAAQDLGFDAVPLLHARAGPIGVITKSAFDQITAEMISLLRDNGPWDGVLLANHGAAVSEEYRDADGEVARRVRELVGPSMPIGMGLDMHGNISPQMIRHTTAVTIYRTNPHLDARARAFECAEMIFRTAGGQIRPQQWLEMPPMVVNIVKQFTGEEPMKSLVEDSLRAQSEPGMLSTSIAEGYPYADVEEMGMSFLAIADGDLDLARSRSRWMATRAFARRSEMNVEVPGARKALEMALARYDANPPAGPVVLMDVGDNIGGGSSADSTVILSQAQRMGISGLLQSLYDPEAVQKCVTAGVGGTLNILVGAKTDDLHGSPVRVEAQGVSPRPAYQPIASSIILVNTPGVTTGSAGFPTAGTRTPVPPTAAIDSLMPVKPRFWRHLITTRWCSPATGTATPRASRCIRWACGRKDFGWWSPRESSLPGPPTSPSRRASSWSTRPGSPPRTSHLLITNPGAVPCIRLSGTPGIRRESRACID